MLGGRCGGVVMEVRIANLEGRDMDVREESTLVWEKLSGKRHGDESWDDGRGRGGG
jgi:hypothetical protein